MKLTKVVRDLVAGDFFYIDALRFEVEEAEEPALKVFWRGNTSEEIEVVSLLIQGPVFSGWENMPADDRVCIVSPEEYAALQQQRSA